MNQHVLCTFFSLLLVYVIPASLARQPAIKALLGELTMRFSETSIGVQGSWGSSELSWTAFTSAARVADCYALFVLRASSYVIPRKDFASPQDEARFVALVREKLGGAAKLNQGSSAVMQAQALRSAQGDQIRPSARFRSRSIR